MTGPLDGRAGAGDSAEVLCVLSLGSNLGDRRRHLGSGLARLAGTRGLRVDALSRLVESEPWGPVAQGPYLNLLARMQVQVGAGDLLGITQGIEAEAGRDRGVRYGPRTLDIDIIFFGDFVLDTPSLTLPHPFWRARAFVRDLLGDILPQGGREFLVHPGVAAALKTGGRLSPELREMEPILLTDLLQGSGEST